MDNRTKQIILYSVAVSTILAAIFAPPEQDTVQLTKSTPHLLAAKNYEENIKRTPESLVLIPKDRNQLTDEPNDLFYVKKPPQQKTFMPAPPTAPPLPFLYMGKMIENGELTVFLTRNNKPYVVHRGDVLDSEYRVNAVNPLLVEFTYLPLQQVQALNIGESK